MKIAIGGEGFDESPDFYHGKRINRGRFAVRVDNLACPAFWCEIAIPRETFLILSRIGDCEIDGGIKVVGRAGGNRSRFRRRVVVERGIVTIHVTDDLCMPFHLRVHMDQIAMRGVAREYWADPEGPSQILPMIATELGNRPDDRELLPA